MLIGTAIDGLTLSQPVFIDEKARARHIYVLGQTGTGKSIALENMAAHAIQNGEGICFIDPHGQSAETLVSQIPETRADDLIYIDLANRETVPSLNFMTDIPLADRPRAASNIVEGFKHIYGEDSWGPRMEYIFLCSVRSLMDNQLTLLALPRLFIDPIFREKVVLNTRDNFVRHTFWGQQFPTWQKKFGPELTSPIDNKIGALLSVPTLRAIVSQRKNSFTLREVMDNPENSDHLPQKRPDRRSVKPLRRAHRLSNRTSSALTSRHPRNRPRTLLAYRRRIPQFRHGRVPAHSLRGP